jgi:NADH/NAD ratio-sensing transcriptional regulator Rex
MNTPGKASLPVIKRLPKYYRYLRTLKNDGITSISSRELAAQMGTTASQVRQDFNCIGDVNGRQGIGYSVENLLSILEHLLFGNGDLLPTILIGCIMITLGSLSALGYGPLAGVTVFGMQFLDFFDFLTNSVMMPIAAIATCLLVSRIVGVEKIEEEVTREGQPFRRKPVFNFMLRYLCPIFAAIILASSVANALGWIAM